jgi:hypothetical protein
MSPLRVASKQVIASILLVATELILFCTLGTPKSTLVQAFGMIFALVVYLPAPVIFRGLLMVLIVRRWTNKPQSASETIVKFLIFIAPIFSVGFLQMTSVTHGSLEAYAGQFFIYIAAECSLCFMFLKLNKMWTSQKQL